MFTRCQIVLLLLLVSALACAMKGVFWQPQLRDNSVTEVQWTSLMQTLRQQGFDTLVLQWTQYGDAFADENGRFLLRQRAEHARAAGLKVVLGLNADPAFFDRQKQPAAALEHYLGRLRVADIAQAKRWRDQMAFQPDGWYISAEIDDHNWRNTHARELLLSWLENTRKQLTAVENKPVYISSFFAGNMTPESYSQMLAEIHVRGINVWVQDGRGVGTLSDAVRDLYLAASSGCQGDTPTSGIVYEIFSVRPGKTFSAVPQPADAIAKALRQSSSCGKDRLYFSLRYLPVAENTLKHD